MRDMMRDGEGNSNNNEANNAQDSVAMASILPILNKVDKDTGIDKDTLIDVLMTLTSNRNANLYPLVLTQLLRLANVSGRDIPARGEGGAIKEIVSELKSLFQTPSQSQFDPNTLILKYLLENNNNRGNNGQAQIVSLLIDKLNTLSNQSNEQKYQIMINQMQQNFKDIIEEVARMKGEEKPIEKFMQQINFVKDLLGENRHRTDAELNADIRKYELAMKREDNRFEKQMERQKELKKEEKDIAYISLIKDAIDSFTGGKGLGAVVGEIINAKAQKQIQNKDLSPDIKPKHLDLL